MTSQNRWIPEIYYEDYSREGQSMTSGIPFINVPKEHNMPSTLFMYEARDLSDSVDDECENEIILHSYANMLLLKVRLTPEDYDKVRLALGLKPLQDAVNLGQKINEKINVNLEKSS